MTVNGRARNNVTAKLWRAEAFVTPPVLNTAEPVNVSYQIGSSITTGVAYGGEGAYRFTGMDDGAYYVSLIVDSQVDFELIRGFKLFHALGRKQLGYFEDSKHVAPRYHADSALVFDDH